MPISCHVCFLAGFTGVVSFSVSSTCCNRNSSVVAIDQLANVDSCQIDLGEFYCSTMTYCTVTEENIIGKVRDVTSEKKCRSLCK